MKNIVSVLLLGAIAFSTRLSAADAEPQWKMQVSGLRVIAPAPGGNDDLRAFNWSDGITVAVVVTAPAGKIVNIDAEGSKLTAFTDDKGGNLLASKSENHFGDSSFTVWGSFSDKEQGASKSVEIHAPGQPVKGATQFTISGKLLVETASQTKDFTANDVALKPGTKLKFGELAMTIESVNQSVESMEISLNAKQDLSQICKVEFFDPQGNKIESQKYGSSSSSFGGTVDITQTFQLKKNVDKVKIVMTSWTDLKTTEVPIAIKTGVGL